jgi:flavodoxin
VNVGIFVYSHTGHTLTVAEKVKERLSAYGRTVTLTELETVAPLKMGDTTAELRSTLTLDAYDVVVFACPVRGGTPAPPMRSFLEGLPTLMGKRVVCLVTGILPAAWGREQTLAQMVALCESKGATVVGSGSVWWLSLNRGRQIDDVVDQLSGLL